MNISQNIAAMFDVSSQERGITTKQQLNATQSGPTMKDLMTQVPAEHGEISEERFVKSILFRMRWIASSFTNQFAKAATSKDDDQRASFATQAKQTGNALHNMLERAANLGIQINTEWVESELFGPAVTDWCNGTPMIAKEEAVKARAAALGISESTARQLMAHQSLNYGNRMAASRPTVAVMLPKVLDTWYSISEQDTGDWQANEKLAPDCRDELLWSIIEASGQQMLQGYDNAAMLITREWFLSHGVSLTVVVPELDKNAEAAAGRKREFEARQQDELRRQTVDAINTFSL